MQPLAPGQILAGRYRVLQELGSGGMSRVLLVEDRRSARTRENKPVERTRLALKVVLDADPEFHACLEAEFRVLRNLRHPHLVEVHEFGFLPKPPLPYLVMGYVPGLDLFAATESMDDPARARILLQLTGVLHYLHSRGFLHRDLKPENVRVHEEDGAPRLLDLGLARSIEEIEYLRGGTLEYLAPEVLLQRPSAIASDLYSLGVLIYLVFSRRIPIDAPDADALRDAVLRRQATPLAELRPELPGTIHDLVDRLLRKDPSARPPSAASVARALAAAFDLGDPLPGEAQWTAPPALQAREDLLQPLLDLASRAGLFGIWEDSPAAEIPPLFAILEGEPALGKDRALEEIALRVQPEGVRVHEAVVEESAGPLEPLRNWWPSFPVPDLHKTFAGAEMLEDFDLALARTLSDALPHLARGRPLLLILRGIENASPLLVSVLHNMVRYVAQKPRAARIPFLLLASSTSGESGLGENAAVRALHDSPLVRTIPVRALDLPGAEAYLSNLFESRDLPADLVRLLHETSGGRPGNLTEAASVLVRENALTRDDETWKLDNTMAEKALAGAAARPLLLRRLAALSPMARGVFDLLAVAARPVPPSVLNDLSDRSDWWTGLEELRAHDMARSAGRAFVLTAPALGRAAAEELPEVRRHQLHTRYSQLLDTLPGNERLPVLAHRARHAHHAGADLAHDLCRRAGEALRRDGNARAARRYFAWALETAGPDDVRGRATILRELGEICLGLDDLEDLERYARALLAIPSAEVPIPLRAHAIDHLLRCLAWGHRWDEGLALSAEAVDMLDPEEHAGLLAQAIARRAEYLFRFERNDEGIACARRAARLMEQGADASQRARILSVLATAARKEGDLAGERRCYDEQLALCNERPHWKGLHAEALNCLARIDMHEIHLAAAAAGAREAIAVARDAGRLRSRAVYHFTLANILLLDGDSSGANREIQEGLRLLRLFEGGAPPPFVRRILLYARITEGNDDEAEALLQQDRAEDPSGHDPTHLQQRALVSLLRNQVRAAEADLRAAAALGTRPEVAETVQLGIRAEWVPILLARGEFDDAMTQIAAILALTERMNSNLYLFEAYMGLATAAAHLGDHPALALYTARTQRALGRKGGAYPRARTLFLRGIQEEADERPDAALTLYAQASSILDPLGVPQTRVAVLLRWIDLLLRARRAEDACQLYGERRHFLQKQARGLLWFDHAILRSSLALVGFGDEEAALTAVQDAAYIAATERLPEYEYMLLFQEGELLRGAGAADEGNALILDAAQRMRELAARLPENLRAGFTARPRIAQVLSLADRIRPEP